MHVFIGNCDLPCLGDRDTAITGFFLRAIFNSKTPD